ncbi:MAG: lipopolysaccharide biosynthesis protein [Planctomycetales bacterium]|nr:lipopolysaccharide biosynthesis protein [Planctomycetales bacterium]
MTDTNTAIQKEEPDLYKRSVKGVYWVIASQITLFFLGFAKSIFIANYFVLIDLGIISIAVMLMEILNTFTQTGFDSALIQKKGDVRDYLNTAWTAGLTKGIFLFLVLYLAAPLLTSFKIPEEKIPLAVWVFRAMSLCFLIAGLRNVGVIYFSKNLDFHKTFALSVISALMDIVLSIGLVLVFRSIWGIIAARLATACVDCAGSYVLSSYRPRLHFKPSKARELWKFGRWIFGQNITGYFLEGGDNFFIWFYLGIQPLALYRYAYRFSNTPATHITQVISQVFFPAYSKIQDDLPRLRDAYLKVLKVTALLSIPTSFLIFVLGPDFVRLFLKEHMHPMIFVLQILAVKGLLNSIGSTRGPLFYALGKVRENWLFQCLRLLAFAVTIYPLTKRWGIEGAALSCVFAAVAIRPFIFRFLCRVLQCSAWSMLFPSILPLAAALTMTLVLFAAKHVIFTPITYLSFAGLAVMGVFVYAAVLGVLDFTFQGGFRKIVQEQMQLVSQEIKKRKTSAM